MKNFLLASAVSLTLLAACSQTPQAPTGEPILSGTVDNVGKKGFTLKSDEHYIFVNMDSGDAAVLKRLKKGEKVTIYGKMADVQPKNKAGSGSTLKDVEMDEIVLQNGEHIKLTQ